MGWPDDPHRGQCESFGLCLDLAKACSVLGSLCGCFAFAFGRYLVCASGKVDDSNHAYFSSERIGAYHGFAEIPVF